MATDTSSFSAIGRPAPPPTKYRTTAMDSLASVESWGASPGTSLPIRFTDDSIISVAVMRPEDVERRRQSHQADAQFDAQSATTAVGSEIGNDEKTKKKEKKSLSSLFRRSSASTSSSKGGDEKFTMRQITRRDYLLHYAKDDAGRYIGDAEPAVDCILRGKDVEKYADWDRRWDPSADRGREQGRAMQKETREEKQSEKEKEQQKEMGVIVEEVPPSQRTSGKDHGEDASGFRNEIPGEQGDAAAEEKSSTGSGRLFGLKGLRGGARDNDDGVIR